MERTTKATRRAQALRMLAEGESIDAVCRAVGVSRSTTFRWRQDPRFAARLLAIQEGRIEEAKLGLSGLLDDALRVMGEILRSKKASALVKLKAAEIVLARSLKELQVTAPTEKVEAVSEADLRAEAERIVKSRDADADVNQH